jgi:hypothetical protein
MIDVKQKPTVSSSIKMPSFYSSSAKGYIPPQDRPQLQTSAVENSHGRPERKRRASSTKSLAPIKKRTTSQSILSQAKENSPDKSLIKTPKMTSPCKNRFFKHRKSSPSKRSRAIKGVSIQLHKGFKVQVNLNAKKESLPMAKRLMESTVVLNSCDKTILDIVDNQSSSPDIKSTDSGCDSKSSASWGTEGSLAVTSGFSLESPAEHSESPSLRDLPAERNMVSPDSAATPKKKMFPIFEGIRRSPRLKVLVLYFCESFLLCILRNIISSIRKSMPSRKSPKQIIKKIIDKDGREQMTLVSFLGN